MSLLGLDLILSGGFLSRLFQPGFVGALFGLLFGWRQL